MDVLQSMQRKEVFEMNTLAQKNCPYCHPYSGIPGDDAQEFDDRGDEDNYSKDWGIDLYITHGNQLTVMASAGYFGDYYIEKHPFNRILIESIFALCAGVL